MGGEVIRGVGGTRTLPLIPAGVEPNAGGNPRQHRHVLQMGNQHPAPLARRAIVIVQMFEEVIVQRNVRQAARRN